ncbi:MAG: riboflavin synthase [Candidatus Omnitrophota bacterium]
MFTGIVTEVGKVKRLVRKAGVVRLEILCERTLKGVNLGDSVAVNGVCLSVVGSDGYLSFDVVGNTFKNTSLKRLRPAMPVNLENALKAGDSMGGHMVSGHVDGERTVKKNRKTADGWVLDIAAGPGDEKYLLPKGSVAVDGVSLTIGEVSRGSFRIFLIPHTLCNTVLPSRKAGDHVNVEFDMAAKHAARKTAAGAITRNMLIEKGFL